MKSTTEWLDAAKVAQGLTSDYQLAQRWNVSRSLISAYRHQREYLSEETAAKVASDTGAELQYVLACAAGERAKMPSARDAWRLLAARLATVAGVVTLAILATEPLYQESFFILVNAVCTGPLCIMLNPHIALVAAVLFMLFNVLPFLPNKKN